MRARSHAVIKRCFKARLRATTMSTLICSSLKAQTSNPNATGSPRGSKPRSQTHLCARPVFDLDLPGPFVRQGFNIAVTARRPETPKAASFNIAHGRTQAARRPRAGRNRTQAASFNIAHGRTQAARRPRAGRAQAASFNIAHGDTRDTNSCDKIAHV